MAVTVGDLIARLKLDIADFEKGTKKAKKEADDLAGISGLGKLKGALQGVETNLSSAGVQTGKLGAVITALANPITIAIAAVAALAAGAAFASKAIADNAEEVKELMAVSGLGAEAADNLADTFRLLGVGSGVLTTAFFKLGQEIDQGGQGLTRLGISIFETNGALKAEGDLLLEVRDKISGMSSASERSAALMDLFGRAGRSLASVMAMSNEEFERYRKLAEETSPWNDKLQAQGLALSRAWTLLSMTFDGFIIRIGSVFIGAVTKVIDVLAVGVGWFNKLFDVVARFTGLFPEAMGEAEKKAQAAMQIPRAIADAMEKERIDARLKAHQAAIGSILGYEQARFDQGKITEQQLLEAEVAALDQRRAAEQTAFAEQGALVKKSGDQFGQQMQSLTVQHNAAMTTIHDQREALVAKLKTLGIKADKEQIEAWSKALDKFETMSENAVEKVEREHRDAMNFYDILRRNDLISEGRHQDALVRLDRDTNRNRMRAQSELMEQRIADLRRVNDAERLQQQQQAQLLQQSAILYGKYTDFIEQELKLQLLASGTVWNDISQGIGSVLQGIRALLFEHLFEFFKTGTIDAKKLFADLLNTMLRAITDFLAAQAVKAMLNLALTGVNALAGFFGAAEGGLVPGRDPRDTLIGFLSPGELVLNPKQANLFLSIIDKVTGSNLGAGAGGAALSDAISRGLGDVFGATASANFTAGGLEGLLFGTPATGTELGIQPATAGLLGVGGTVGQTGMTLAELGANIGAVLSAFKLFTGGMTSAEGLSTLVGAGGALTGFAIGAGATGNPLVGAAVAAVFAILSALIPGFLSQDAKQRRFERFDTGQSALATVVTAIDSGDYRAPIVGANTVGDLVLEMANQQGAGAFSGEPWQWKPNPASDVVETFFRSQGFHGDTFNAGRVDSIGELLLASGTPGTLVGISGWEDLVLRALATRFTGDSFPITRLHPEIVQFEPAQLAESTASAATGGLIRVHDGEVVVPRPFADEFPRVAGALGREGGGITINLSLGFLEPSQLSPEAARRIARTLGRAFRDEFRRLDLRTVESGGIRNG